MRFYLAYRACFYFLVAGIVLMLGRHVIGMALESAQENNYGDSAFLYYLSWLIDKHDAVPFRDILETNYPGTYGAYGLITKIWGYTDHGYRAANFCLFATLLAMSFLLLRKISITAAIIGLLYFTEYYLDNPTLALQREYLAMFPIVGSLLLADSKNLSGTLTYFLIGLCFAAAAAIKPPLCIGLPFVLWYATKNRTQQTKCFYQFLRGTGTAGAGFLTGVFICLLWLFANGALHDFITITTQYLPLYLQLNLQTSSEESTLLHMPSTGELFNILWQPAYESIPILLSLAFIALSRNQQKIRLALLLAWLVIAYRLYVFLSIKNFDYHYLPAKYFMFIASTMVMTLLPIQVAWTFRLAHLGWVGFVFHFLLQIQTGLTFGDHTNSAQREAAKQDLVNFLRTHKQAAESIQPRVQGTYGPVFPALLELQIPIAITRFPLNQVFYHHIDDPYIVSITQEYMRAMQDSRPTYIIDDNAFDGYKSISGENAFPEYDAFIRNHYHRVYDNLQRAEAPDQFIVYRLNTQ